MSLGRTLVDVYKPIIYVPREQPNRFLKDVYYEIQNDYAILWYHWPRDGLEDHEDFEPVILFFQRNKLEAIAIRPHRRYVHYDSWTGEGLRPVIIFDGIYHGPILLKGDILDPLLRAYARFSIRMDDYSIANHHVPPWFIKDGTSVSVYDYAHQVSKSLI